MLLPRFTLAKVYPTSPGIMKICQFNPNAKDFIVKFLADNKELLVTAIRASAAYRFDKMQIQIRETKSQKKRLNKETWKEQCPTSSERLPATEQLQTKK